MIRSETNLVAGLKRLDPDVPEHWTTDGLPRVDMVANLSGEQQCTRDDITDLAPDLTREAAAAAGVAPVIDPAPADLAARLADLTARNAELQTLLEKLEKEQRSNLAQQSQIGRDLAAMNHTTDDERRAAAQESWNRTLTARKAAVDAAVDMLESHGIKVSPSPLQSAMSSAKGAIRSSPRVRI